jgi:hypothetical protein
MRRRRFIASFVAAACARVSAQQERPRIVVLHPEAWKRARYTNASFLVLRSLATSKGRP